MIKIVKADSEGNIKITENELNILLKEAYNEGYDKGYAYGKSSESVKWRYYYPTWKPEPVTITTDGTNSDTTICCKHGGPDYTAYCCKEEENGVPQ